MNTSNMNAARAILAEIQTIPEYDRTAEQAAVVALGEECERLSAKLPTEPRMTNKVGGMIFGNHGYR